MVTTDVIPEVGRRGTIIEYCYHYGENVGDDLNFCDGSDWRQVKKDIENCILAAKLGEKYEDIVHIEKVWHTSQENWVGYATLFDYRECRADAIVKRLRVGNKTVHIV